MIFAKILPPDRSTRILGIPNCWAISIALSIVSVGVELLLHADGVFHWHYWWWNVATFPVIVVFGYLTFYVVAFRVHDMQEPATPAERRRLARRASFSRRGLDLRAAAWLALISPRGSRDGTYSYDRVASTWGRVR